MFFKVAFSGNNENIYTSWPVLNDILTIKMMGVTITMLPKNKRVQMIVFFGLSCSSFSIIWFVLLISVSESDSRVKWLKSTWINSYLPAKSSSSSGLLYAYLEVRSTSDITKSSDVKLNVNTDYDFGNQTVTGNSVKVHYAGILASNAKLFDSSM